MTTFWIPEWFLLGKNIPRGMLESKYDGVQSSEIAAICSLCYVLGLSSTTHRIECHGFAWSRTKPAKVIASFGSYATQTQAPKLLVVALLHALCSSTGKTPTETGYKRLAVEKTLGTHRIFLVFVHV